MGQGLEILDQETACRYRMWLDRPSEKKKLEEDKSRESHHLLVFAIVRGK